MTWAHSLLMDRPRRLLSLDGGGLKGLISLGVLRRIETILRAQSGRDDFRLADYFDFISGTSTGAIIAACLSCGHAVDDIERLYLESARLIFSRSRWHRKLHARYDCRGLEGILKRELGAETDLGSERLRTLLLMVMRNATTDSPWLITNNPFAKFNDRASEDCNLRLKLWQLVRASTAAPTFFAPEMIDVGRRRFVFCDGAITPFNNPSFQAFLIATADPHGLRWRTGTDRMLLVSVGTGINDISDETLRPSRMTLLFNATTLPLALMNAAAAEQDLLCRMFGDCRVGDPLDMEVGDMIGHRGPVAEKQFSYLRYDVSLTGRGLNSIGCPTIRAAGLALDAVGRMADFIEIGRALAETRVRPEHFNGFPVPSAEKSVIASPLKPT